MKGKTENEEKKRLVEIKDMKCCMPKVKIKLKVKSIEKRPIVKAKKEASYALLVFDFFEVVLELFGPLTIQGC